MDPQQGPPAPRRFAEGGHPALDPAIIIHVGGELAAVGQYSEVAGISPRRRSGDLDQRERRPCGGSAARQDGMAPVAERARRLPETKSGACFPDRRRVSPEGAPLGQAPGRPRLRRAAIAPSPPIRKNAAPGSGTAASTLSSVKAVGLAEAK